MSSAKQGMKRFSLCLHIRKSFHGLFHRANARERTNPTDSFAALRIYDTKHLEVQNGKDYFNRRPAHREAPYRPLRWFIKTQGRAAEFR
ncbi:hypothetical protein FYJ38_04110 [Clostridium sp. WB02_MRS01]|nr:hypothetical protein [Clostridium sp. WB02_MRS01]